MRIEPDLLIICSEYPAACCGVRRRNLTIILSPRGYVVRSGEEKIRSQERAAKYIFRDSLPQSATYLAGFLGSQGHGSRVSIS